MKTPVICLKNLIVAAAQGLLVFMRIEHPHHRSLSAIPVRTGRAGNFRR